MPLAAPRQPSFFVLPLQLAFPQYYIFCGGRNCARIWRRVLWAVCCAEKGDRYGGKGCPRGRWWGAKRSVCVYVTARKEVSSPEPAHKHVPWWMGSSQPCQAFPIGLPAPASLSGWGGGSSRS